MKTVTLLLLLALSSKIFAAELFYFGSKPRVLELNDSNPTDLLFPSPAITPNCHPQNVINLTVMDSLSNVHSLNLPQGMNYLNQKGADSIELLDRFLKLTPLVVGGSTTCEITLANGEIVPVTFQLKKYIRRPIVEFKSKFQVKAKLDENFGGMKALKIFKELTQGQPVYFMDVTDENKLISHSQIAAYEMEYVGSNSAFKGWVISGSTKKSMFSETKLRNVKIGDLYFSAFKAPTRKKKQIKRGEKFKLYILSRGDLSARELKGYLP